MFLREKSLCRPTLRNGTYAVCFACFLFCFLNFLAIFLPITHNAVRAPWYIHVVVFLVFLHAGLLLLAAVYWDNKRALFVWLMGYSLITGIAILFHDLRRCNMYMADDEAVVNLLLGVAILNIVLDFIFLFVVTAYYHQTTQKLPEEMPYNKPVTTL